MFMTVIYDDSAAWTETVFHLDPEPPAENQWGRYHGNTIKLETVVVTRHTGLIDYLKEMRIIDDSVNVIPHATVEKVKGKHVIGVLPMHLAAHAAFVTEVALNIPAEKRGQELSVDEVRAYATGINNYRVDRVVIA